MAILLVALALAGCRRDDSGTAGEHAGAPEETRVTALPTVLAAGVAPTAGDATAMAARELEPSADLMARWSDAAADVCSLHQMGEMLAWTEMEGLGDLGMPPQTMRSAFEQWYLAPGKVRLEQSAPTSASEEWQSMDELLAMVQPGLTIWDGADLWTYTSSLNAYSREDPDTTLAIGVSPAKMVLPAVGLIAELAGTYDLKRQGTESVGGRECEVVGGGLKPGVVSTGSVPGARQDLRLWIARDTGRLVQTVQRAEYLATEPRASSILTLTILSEDVNPEVDPERFVFTPPAGASESPPLREVLGEVADVISTTLGIDSLAEARSLAGFPVVEVTEPPGGCTLVDVASYPFAESPVPPHVFLSLSYECDRGTPVLSQGPAGVAFLSLRDRVREVLGIEPEATETVEVGGRTAQLHRFAGDAFALAWDIDGTQCRLDASDASRDEVLAAAASVK